MAITVRHRTVQGIRPGSAERILEAEWNQEHIVEGEGGEGGGVDDGDKGDITVSDGATVWTIDNNAVTTAKIIDSAVTLAKMANINASRVLGRQSSSAGAPQELTVAGGITISGTEVRSPAFTASATAPVSPVVGDEWVDTDTGILYTYYNDGSSSQWVEF